MSTTFSNYSEEDLLITQESYKALIVKLKINRFSFSGMPAYKERIENYTRDIDRLVVLLEAIDIEISKREIHVQG